MNYINRVGYYFIGLSFGIIIMIFIFNQKGTRCNYSPQSRVLNDLKNKKWIYNETKNDSLIDSLKYFNWIQNGKINFSKSDFKKDSCNIYCIESIQNKIKVEIYVLNCNENVRLVEMINK